MNVVITGTSRGIGYELTRQALGRGDRVLAIARDVARVRELGPGVETLALDLTTSEAGAQIAKALGAWGEVDVLINDAGVYRQGTTTEDFLHSFHVNSVAPFIVTEAALPWLKKSKAPKAVHVTSKMGSIEDNTGGGAYAYRASKAALNMINRSLSVDHEWLTSVVIHPGWVQTDMGGHQAPTSVEESATGIWSVTGRLKKGDSGEFFDFRGETIPW